MFLKEFLSVCSLSIPQLLLIMGKFPWNNSKWAHMMQFLENNNHNKIYNFICKIDPEVWPSHIPMYHH